MIAYPSIDDVPQFGKDVIAFDKLDGSNIRTEWTRKNGFSKFGSRKVLIDETSSLAEAILLVNEKYGEMEKVFRKQRLNKAVCFFEFYGENSAFGQHEDEPHTVTLIDVWIEKKGFLDPRDFIGWFKGFETPEVVFRGKFNKETYNEIKAGILPGVTYEGVVCKGLHEGKKRVWNFKVKSDQWLNDVKERYGMDPETLKYVI